MRSPLPTSYLAAGWLFADLLLALAVVFLASATTAPVAVTSASTQATPIPAGSYRIGVETEPVILTGRFNAHALLRGSAAEKDRVQRWLATKTASLDGRRAAFVLTFGSVDGRPGLGDRYSARINALLDDARPAVFGKASSRSFHDLSGPTGQVKLEIYLFTT